jgi:3-hydroxyisobutyrate dehydrogenase-like beta-hydroxyacid dehydrogenase
MPNSVVIGVLHPGEMGSVVGRCLAERGHEVLWVSAGRGSKTAERAAAAGLTEVGSVAELTGRAEVVLSICPPHAATGVAQAVAAAGFTGTYVDANAVSPQTAQQVAAIVTGGGATYVDGGIIGPPPAAAGSTRLYLSGDAAESVRELFDQTPLEARIVTAGPWSASSLKMAYAAWTKGSGALLLTVHALAQAEGVGEDLAAEWARSLPGLSDRLPGTTRSAAEKGWRWVGEMEEIAATMAAAGLPDGFHLAAAEVYKNSPEPGN